MSSMDELKSTMKSWWNQQESSLCWGTLSEIEFDRGVEDLHNVYYNGIDYMKDKLKENREKRKKMEEERKYISTMLKQIGQKIYEEEEEGRYYRRILKMCKDDDIMESLKKVIN